MGENDLGAAYDSLKKEIVRRSLGLRGHSVETIKLVPFPHSGEGLRAYFSRVEREMEGERSMCSSDIEARPSRSETVSAKAPIKKKGRRFVAKLIYRLKRLFGWVR